MLNNSRTRIIGKIMTVILTFCLLYNLYPSEPDYNAKTYVNQDSNFKDYDPNSPVTIVIPCATKDLEVLPHSLSGVKKYITNKVYQIVLIAPDTKEMRQFSKDHHLKFIDENTIVNKQEFDQLARKYYSDLIPPYNQKPSWLYQQLLKLKYAYHSETEDYFVIDVDVMLLKPLILKNDKGYHFFVKKRVYKGDYNYANKILGADFVFQNSFIADMMIFNKQVVKKMIDDIENHTKKTIDDAIIAYNDVDLVFSEYDTYGLYVNYIMKVKAYYTQASMKRKDRKNLINNLSYQPWSDNLPYVAYHDGWVYYKESPKTRDDIIPLIKSYLYFL
jgi:hypothetical protein